MAKPALAENAGQAQKCIDAHNHAQDLRADGKLLEARGELSRCGNAACPAVVREDCVKLASQVNDELPALVVAVLDSAGADVVPGRIFVNGEERTDLLYGRPVPLNPGHYEIQVELKSGKTLTGEVVLLAGEKQRRFELRPSKPAKQAAASDGAWKKPAGFVAMGVGAVGLGLGIVFGLKGLSDEDKYENDCTGCTDQDYRDLESSRKTKFLIADAGFATAVVGIGFGTYFLLTAPPAPTENAHVQRAPALGFALSSRGAQAMLRAHF
jgi:hypothetical protein